MPDLSLTPSEATAIAGYLLPGIPEEQGIAYAVYRGQWTRLPSFDDLAPDSTGDAETFSATVAGGGDHFGLRFLGQVRVPADGTYRFHLGSDDGSRMWIDGRSVIDNDGVHGVKWQTVPVDLTAGLHSVQIDYFENEGGEELYVEWEGPNMKRHRLGQDVERALETPLTGDDRIRLDPQRVRQGSELYVRLGCVACHQLDAKKYPSMVKANAAPVAIDDARSGCLAMDVQAVAARAAGGPGVDRPVDYSLSDEQRQTLRSVVTARSDISVAKGPTPGAGAVSDANSILANLLVFNCVACHQRDQLGGPLADRNAFFQGTQPEMGDEGRIPPDLTGVGAKLAHTWLKGVLENGAKDRPYMKARMPRFGGHNVGSLAQQLERQDAQDPLPEIRIPRKDARRAGWQLVGTKGFSCIKCHTFGRYRATGIQAMDMTTMTRRLREDWFRRYLRNPQAFRRGTRMPSAWPAEGPSLITDVLDGDSDRQIQAIWDYLSDSTRARLPQGLITNSMELVPITEAILYRNFIAGAGPRAIGVGYPEGLNIAFDAQQIRLALIWQGAFIDASRHWNGRGQGFQPPAGENVVHFAEGPDWANLPSPTSPWPTLVAGRPVAGRFRGYHVTTDQRPTFHYELAGARIQDWINPREDENRVALVREMAVEPIDQGAKLEIPGDSLVWFRAARANVIEPLDDQTFRVDGTLVLRVEVPDGATILKHPTDDGAELRIGVPLRKQTTRLTIEYVW